MYKNKTKTRTFYQQYNDYFLLTSASSNVSKVGDLSRG